MGKTLKRLRTSVQYPDISFGSSYKFIQQIINTYSCTAQTADGSNDAFDLGFFTDSDG